MSGANACPELEASALSRALFLWNDALIEKGYERPLQAEDVWDVRHDMATVFCREEVAKVLFGEPEEERDREEYYLLRAFFRTYSCDIAVLLQRPFKRHACFMWCAAAQTSVVAVSGSTSSCLARVIWGQVVTLEHLLTCQTTE